MGGLIQYPHVFYYWKRYSRRLYPPSAYGLRGLDMLHATCHMLHVTCYMLHATCHMLPPLHTVTNNRTHVGTE